VIVSRIALLPLLALVVGCSAGSAAPSVSGTRIDVTLTDALRIEPANITVPAGMPVTFVVTNTGASDHEFYLGDEAAQAEHEREMQSMGGMMHDEPNGIAIEPGQTEELTFTFADPGATLAGCHVAGHYAGGMWAAITVAAQ
jgi:uncharacterized cupredoxin-like copper-binding protein